MPIDIAKVYKKLKSFSERVKVPVGELVEAQTKDPEKILITTILTARTKDEVTTKVVKRLWKNIKRAKDFDKYSEEEIQEMIYPVGFYRNKAKYLKALGHALNEHFDGKIPDDVDELTKLPGVGRKTANLVVALGFKKPAICVDIHVHRIMNRLGYVNTKTPYETEMALRAKLPQKYWITINGYMVAFGQHCCRPVSPHCSRCPLQKTCPKIGVEKSR